jgi:hypothetical protein
MLRLDCIFPSGVARLLVNQVRNPLVAALVRGSFGYDTQLRGTFVGRAMTQIISPGNRGTLMGFSCETVVSSVCSMPLNVFRQIRTRAAERNVLSLAPVTHRWVQE